MENGIQTRHYGFIDYAKGIMILIVILDHTNGVPFNFLPCVLALFFVASGFTHNPGKRTVGESIIRRFKGIMFPFWKYMAFVALIFIPLRDLCLGIFSWMRFPQALEGMIWGSTFSPFRITGYKPFYLLGQYIPEIDPTMKEEALSGTATPMWFLPAMFCASVFFYALVDWCEKNGFRKAIAIIGLMLGCALERLVPALYQLPWGMGPGFMGAAFMLCGYWIKQADLLSDGGKPGARSWIVLAFSLAVYVVLAYFINPGVQAISWSYYGPFGLLSIPLSLLIGVAGSFCFLFLCSFISRASSAGLKRLLKDSGKASLRTLCLHLPIINIIDAVPVLLFHIAIKPSTTDLMYLHLSGWVNSVYRICEGIVAIIICIQIDKAVDRAKKNRKAPAQMARA